MFFSRRRRIKKRKKPENILIKQVVVGILLTILIGGLVTGIWYGTRVPALTISEVTIVGGETIKQEELLGIALEELEGTYFTLIPKRFAFMYPHDSISDRIASIPRMKNVHIERTNRTELTITFEEYSPFALWCKEFTSKSCLFIDYSGYAFSEAPLLQGSAFLRFSIRGVEPLVRTEGFSRDFISESNRFINEVYDSFGLNIIQIEKTSKNEIMYYIAGGGQIKVSLLLPVIETLRNLETILTSEEFNHIEPGNFQYIDLRYGNKIFINEEEPNEEVATTSTETGV